MWRSRFGYTQSLRREVYRFEVHTPCMRRFSRRRSATRSDAARSRGLRSSDVNRAPTCASTLDIYPLNFERVAFGESRGYRCSRARERFARVLRDSQNTPDRPNRRRSDRDASFSKNDRRESMVFRWTPLRLHLDASLEARARGRARTFWRAPIARRSERATAAVGARAYPAKSASIVARLFSFFSQRGISFDVSRGRQSHASVSHTRDGVFPSIGTPRLPKSVLNLPTGRDLRFVIVSRNSAVFPARFGRWRVQAARTVRGFLEHHRPTSPLNHLNPLSTTSKISFEESGDNSRSPGSEASTNHRLNVAKKRAALHVKKNERGL